MKSLKAVFINLLLAVMVGIGVSAAGASVGQEVNVFGVSAIVLGLGLVSNAVSILFGGIGFGLLMAGVNVEIWRQHIEENLFKEIKWLQYVTDVSSQVLGGNVVHIAQAGAKPTAVKNRSSFPATVVQRADTDVTYALDWYSTDPSLITGIEEATISYDKRQSIFRDHFGVLEEDMAADLLYKFSTSVTANIIATTGSLVATNLAPSATGTRRKLLKGDIKKGVTILKKSKVRGEIVAIVPTDMFDELQDDADFMLANVHIEKTADLSEGRIAKWAGATIIEDLNTTVYTSADAPKAPGTAGASGDKQAVIMFCREAVEKAVGTVNFNEEERKATMFGTVYSADVRWGGRIRRSGGEGVVAITQAAS